MPIVGVHHALCIDIKAQQCVYWSRMMHVSPPGTVGDHEVAGTAFAAYPADHAEIARW